MEVRLRLWIRSSFDKPAKASHYVVAVPEEHRGVAEMQESDLLQLKFTPASLGFTGRLDGSGTRLVLGQKDSQDVSGLSRIIVLFQMK